LTCPPNSHAAKNLKTKMGQPGFWDYPDQAKSVVGEVKGLKSIIDPVEDLLRAVGDVRALYQLGEEVGDADFDQ